MDGAALKATEANAVFGGEPSFYRGTGKAPASGNKAPTSGFLGVIRRRPKSFVGLLLTLAFAIAGGTFLASTNSLLPAALNEVVTEITDLQYTVNSKRYLKITQNILSGSETKPTLAGRWTGRQKYTYMSKSFQERLEKQGIKVEGTGKNRTLTFTNGETKVSGITANQFLDEYKNNTQFREAYNTAKRGRIMGFFDQRAINLFQRLGINRNLNKDYKQTGDAEADNKKFREEMTKKLDGDTNNLDSKTHYISEETETDADGKKVPKVNKETNIPTKNIEGDTPELKAKSYLTDISNRASNAAGGICAIMKVFNMVSVAVAANEIYQSINYFMGLAENPSKMQMGYGDESAINSMLNFMTTPAEVEVENFQDKPTISENGDNITVALQGENGKIKTNGSPMESQGMMKIMTGAPVSQNVANNYSLERSLAVVGGALTTSAVSFQTCAITQGATAAISGIATIAAAIATNGASLAITFTWKKLVAIGISASIMGFLQFMIPTIAKTFFTNSFATAAGIPAGELYAKGAFAANTRVGRSASGLAPSSSGAIKKFLKVHKSVAALDAEVDRANRSPFDLNSKNTFLGSIAYNFATTTSTTFTGKLKNLMRNTSTSIATILGSGATIAAGENDYITTYGDCPLLKSIGAEGDMYCNSITTADADILDLSPSDDEYVEKINPNLREKDDGGFISDNLDCDSEGNCTIIENSPLDQYVKEVNERDSPFGAVDANILAKNASLVDSLGDLGDLVTAAKDLKNLDAATGQKYVNSEDNPDWMNEYRYYQLYINDQRILEQMGNYEDSSDPVTARIEQYATETPLDDSPSGYLARISGLTKDDAQLVLDLAWYANFLENYDSSTRLAFNDAIPGIATSETILTQLDHTFRYRDFARQFESDPHATVAITPERPIYANLRNRNFAA